MRRSASSLGPVRGARPARSSRAGALVAAAVVVASGVTGCAGDDSAAVPVASATSATTSAPDAVDTTTVPPPATTIPTTSTTSTARVTTTTTQPPATTTTATTTTAPAPTYVFPFVGRDVSYGTTHYDYPAVDVFGCGAIVVAPTAGIVLEISTEDRWDPAVNDPATRGGLFVSMLGDDGVRYYVAHLGEVLVAADDVVAPGSPLGVMGATGNARNSECHTHLGLSWSCPGPEWQVRRGEIWPAPYLDAWRSGEQRSPAVEVASTRAEHPTACDEAMALVAGA